MFTSSLTISANVVIEGGNTIIFDGNNTTRHFVIDGSGILTLNDLTLQNGNSTASYGGSIDNGGTLTINNTIFSNNQANGSGGAIENYGPLTITNSQFLNNSSTGTGGAIQNVGFSGTTTITSTLFDGNQSDTDGGAIFNFIGTLNLINSTISNNIALGTGGAFNRLLGTTTTQGTQYINNTCADTYTDNGGNTKDALSTGCPGTVVVNLTVGPMSCSGQNAIFTILTGDGIGGFTINGTGLGLPITFGGPISPPATVTIDGITNPGPDTWTGVTVTELGGDMQTVNLGDITCPPPPIMIPVSTCDFATLQAAVTSANIAGGIINFTCSGTINFTSELVITNNVTINENGQTVIFDGGNSTRHFYVNAGASLTLNDFTLQNGFDGGEGGSISNDGGTVTVTGVTFDNNDTSGLGGAIVNSVGGTPLYHQ